MIKVGITRPRFLTSSFDNIFLGQIVSENLYFIGTRSCEQIDIKQIILFIISSIYFNSLTVEH